MNYKSQTPKQIIFKALGYVFGFTYVIGAFLLLGLLMSDESFSSRSLKSVFENNFFLFLFVISLFIVPFMIFKVMKNEKSS